MSDCDKKCFTAYRNGKPIYADDIVTFDDLKGIEGGINEIALFQKKISKLKIAILVSVLINLALAIVNMVCEFMKGTTP